MFDNPFKGFKLHPLMSEHGDASALIGELEDGGKALVTVMTGEHIVFLTMGIVLGAGYRALDQKFELGQAISMDELKAMLSDKEEEATLSESDFDKLMGL